MTSPSSLGNSFDRTAKDAAAQARLEAVCEESGVNAILKALEALPANKNDFKFTVTPYPNNKSLRFDIIYHRKDVSNETYLFCHTPLPGYRIDCPAPVLMAQNLKAISFILKNENEITCIRGDRPQYSPGAGHYPWRGYEETRYTDMNKIVEQLQDWVKSVAPERVEPLQRKIVEQSLSKSRRFIAKLLNKL